MATNLPLRQQLGPRESQYSLRTLFVVVTGLCVLFTLGHYLNLEPTEKLAALGLLGLGLFTVGWGLVVERFYIFCGGVLLIVGVLLVPATTCHQCLTPQGVCVNRLRQIAVALHNYESVHGALPPAYVADENGKPLHSWRVLLLPFLDGDALYAQYDFSEPWNGPNNSQLAHAGYEFFRCPADRPNAAGVQETSYVAVLGGETIWPGATSARSHQLLDGSTRTLQIIEVRNSGIHWMEPRDLDFAQMPCKINAPVPGGPGSQHRGCCHAVCCDGSVVRLQNELPSVGLRALLTKAGHEDTTPWEKWIR